ncbi:MAG TPA: hypothetical protein VHN55_06015 [Sphingomicrobium sp.]|nr:hypothetical protein [Sphingomicrobium sp.]
MIRNGKILALAAAATLVSGCAQTVVNELRHSGGHPGALLDRHFFYAAHSKQVQLLRSAMIVSMAANVGSGYVEAEDADSFIHQLQAASDEINYMAGHIYPVDGKDPCIDLTRDDCDAYALMYESEAPRLEGRIVKLLLASLPRDRATAFLNAAKTGNVMAAAWRALRLAASAVEGAHRGAAVHRSELELRALLVQHAKSQGVGKGCRGGIDWPVETTNDAAKCMNQPLDDLRAADDTPLPHKVPEQAFDAVFAIMRTSCMLLPLNATIEESGREQRKTECAKIAFKPKLRFGGVRGSAGAATDGNAPPPEDGGAD